MKLFQKQPRIKEFVGYKFNRTIFQVYIGVLFFCVFLIFAYNDFSFESKFYLHCSSEKTFCENPCYLNYVNEYCPDEIRNIQTLEGGFEYGEKPSFLMRNFTWFAILSVILVFVVNHFIHNRGYFKSDQFKKFKEEQEWIKI